MKIKVSKKISSLVLSLAIAFTAVLSSSVLVNAATVKGTAAPGRSFKGEYPASEEGSAKAGVEEKIYFSVPNTVNITVAIWVYKNASDTDYHILMKSATAEETPALNQPNATITIGFTKKLSVTGGTAK